jgi:transcriptional regulator with PAS, ATPase and Fis domain
VDLIDIAKIKGLFESAIDFRAFLNELPIGVAVLDRKRCLVVGNRALEALTGISQQQAAGFPCYHVLRHKICLQGCPVSNLNAESEPVCLESDLINRERQLIPVRVTMAPLKDEKGRLAGFLEIVEDLRLLRERDAELSQAYGFGRLIGRSPQLEKILQIIPLLSQSDSSVLITGETGSGKDLLAEIIHHASQRAKGPYIKVNCGALPETLMESEIFGHRKGAFTGAVEDKPGRFRLAHNGTLYLTEIGDLPLSLQAKLLTFLDDKVVFPLGSTRGFSADVRVIAATHRDLEQMALEGRFREDLLFRLNVVSINLPPLREREGDIRLLLDHFLNAFTGQFKKTITGFSAEALKILLVYPFPGNVRELRNVVEYAVTMCQGGKIQPRQLPAYLIEGGYTVRKAKTEKSRLQWPTAIGMEPDQRWGSMERKLIVEALIKAQGRRGQAAALLGWGRSTLWRKIRRYGIDG